MEIGKIKVDTTIKCQIKLKIQDRVFYSEKTFDDDKSAIQYMQFLSSNRNCNWDIIYILEPLNVPININEIPSVKDNTLKNKIRNLKK